MDTVYLAKYIYLESGETVVGGALSVRNGRIAGVGSCKDVWRTAPARVIDLGDMLLLPGFINMHTHLEESPVRGFCKEHGETFASWNSKKYSRMRQLDEERINNGIRLSAREMISQGITTVVDSSRTGLSATVLAQEPIRHAVIIEVPNGEVLEEGVERVQNRIESGSGNALKYGIGPHALYSLTTREHRRLIEYSYDSKCLWACHVAESAEELQAFCEQSGDFFASLTRTKPWPAGNKRLDPVRYAFAENLIPSHAILIHCNYVNTYELALLAAKRAYVTLCYGYGEEMEHKSFPVEVARNYGVRICLGTEGMTSVGKTNMFDDLFKLKMAYPHISAAELLRWVTKNPAAALKASDKIGGIGVGKYADIIGIHFPHDCLPDKVLETLIISEPDVAFVMVNGEEIII